MIKSISKTLNVQYRVVFALMMREIHTLHGKTKLGYLWAIIQTALGIVFIWMFRSLCRMSPPHGMNVLTFLVMGFVIWGILKNGILKCMRAVEANRSLLTFPQVTPIDVMIARCVVTLFTEVISGIIILFVGYVIGYEIYLNNIGGILYIFLCTFFISLGLGMFFSSLNTIFPALVRVLPIFFRFLMFASGVFFSITPFTGRIGDWILWNPFLQLIEFSRTCVSRGYPADFVSHFYIIQFSLYSLSIGLLFEKYTRKRVLA